MKLIPPIMAFLLMMQSPSLIAQTPEDTIQETSRAVLKQLNENRDKLKSDPAYIRQLVNKLIITHFDFKLMSKLVLANHWQSYASAKQACFVTGFRNLLVERYAYILLSYDDQKISYDASKEIGEKGYRLVTQTISRDGAKPLPIGYAMEQVADEWKVVDLIIDGISLVRSYHGMFQSRIHTQGQDYFIKTFPVCNK